MEAVARMLATLAPYADQLAKLNVLGVSVPLMSAALRNSTFIRSRASGKIPWFQALVASFFCTLGGGMLTAALFPGRMGGWMSTTALLTFVAGWWCIFCFPFDLFWQALYKHRHLQYVTVFFESMNETLATVGGVDGTLACTVVPAVAQSPLAAVVAGVTASSGGGLIARSLKVWRGVSTLEWPVTDIVSPAYPMQRGWWCSIMYYLLRDPLHWFGPEPPVPAASAFAAAYLFVLSANTFCMITTDVVGSPVNPFPFLSGFLRTVVHIPDTVGDIPKEAVDASYRRLPLGQVPVTDSGDTVPVEGDSGQAPPKKGTQVHKLRRRRTGAARRRKKRQMLVPQ